MASIRGFEVKNVKYVKDHEGAMIPYGSLYVHRQKVGEFYADTWGGPMRYEHTSDTISKEDVIEGVLAIPEKMGWDSFYQDFDILIEELIHLKDDEKRFKQLQKENKYLCVYEADKSLPFSATPYVLCVQYAIPAECNVKEEVANIQQEATQQYPGGVLQFYQTLNDFIVH